MSINTTVGKLISFPEAATGNFSHTEGISQGQANSNVFFLFCYIDNAFFQVHILPNTQRIIHNVYASMLTLLSEYVHTHFNEWEISYNQIFNGFIISSHLTEYRLLGH
jgi:hypothetical protein